MAINRFNIRVYGLLINEKHELLLVNETINNFNFTKFPGGGLEFGEGLIDGIKREFKEEAGIQIEIQSHFYTTDFFQQSAFRETDQLISVYYLVSSDAVSLIRLDKHEVNSGNREEKLQFLWVPLNQLTTELLTFPIDKKVVEMLTRNLI
ncbi:MAG: NUDIX hydrolase [Bacteroidia bacterium]|jgi:8-oxo-dGTP diphosphatase|nr:NUDIX hydrolase [Bacteroidia bacterium]